MESGYPACFGHGNCSDLEAGDGTCQCAVSVGLAFNTSFGIMFYIHIQISILLYKCISFCYKSSQGLRDLLVRCVQIKQNLVQVVKKVLRHHYNALNHLLIALYGFNLNK